MRGSRSWRPGEGSSLATSSRRVEAIIHGTTIADNTLIQMNGAVTGLLTTEGFRDELELRRGFKEDIWDVRLEPPPHRATAPPAHGPRTRSSPTARSTSRSTRTARVEAIRRLAKQGVESVAISLLFSFVNPAHERRLAELVARRCPTPRSRSPTRCSRARRSSSAPARRGQRVRRAARDRLPRPADRAPRRGRLCSASSWSCNRAAA